jgi:methyl-accepting chemotaxis protein/CHASE3 domain sensor protein
MFKNFRVGTKIMIGFGVVICILLLISVISYRGLGSASKGYNQYQNFALITRLTGDLEAELLQTRICVKDFVISGSEKDLKLFEQGFQNLMKIYKKGETEIKDPERMEKLKFIKASLDDYHKAFDEIARLTKSRDDIKANRLDPNGTKMRLAINAIMDAARQNRDLECEYHAGHLMMHLLRGRLYIYRYLDTLDEAALALVDQEFGKEMGEHVPVLKKALTTESGKASLQAFLDTKDLYLSAYDDLVKIIKQREDTIENRLFKAGENITDTAEAIRASAVKDGEALGLQVSSNNARAILFLIIFSIISLIISVVLAWVISRQITGPVNQALEAVTRIAAGDLSGEFNAIKSDDEIGQLMESMSQMAANLKKQATGLTEAVNVLSASSSEIVATTTQLASNASETAVSANETTTTVEEVRQTTNVSSQKAKYVSESAQKAAQIAKAGKKAVEDTMEGMSSIKQKMESVAESIVTLSEQSQAIGEIIAAVDDLAEQTNLLAVNASIEAVKAGEQGKGFSVVAQEIKALADQSKQATKRVRAILNDIQKATGKAVMATEEGSKTVDAGARLSVQSGENIQALADAIAEAAQAANQIAASSQQQLVGMDQVAMAMENVKTASAQNAEAAKQMETATHNISELGGKLKELVSWYRIAA